VLETFLMNLLHGARLAAMPPKLLNEDGDMLLLRPLAASAEADIARFAEAMRFPIIPCDLCGSQDGLERPRVKAMLDEWEQARPGTKTNMLRALANSRPSHLLDPALFDFAGLEPSRRAGKGASSRSAEGQHPQHVQREADMDGGVAQHGRFQVPARENPAEPKAHQAVEDEGA
jgi:tRNA 2-thiocytidine biosynthesis protein TtcA